MNSLKQISSAAKSTLLKVIAGLGLLLPACSDAAGDFEHEFTWKEAQTRISVASKPDDFIAAAKTYRKLATAGVRNPAVFYNMGTALILAGRHEDAILPLLRAERYSGTTWEINRNLRIAVAGREKDETIPLPWYRAPLFWHYGLPFHTRLNIAVYAFAAFWLFLTLGKLGLRRFVKPLAAAALLALILFGSSSLATINAENELARSAGPAWDEQPPAIIQETNENNP